MSAAAKQRQYRERCRAGIALYRVALPQVDVECLLDSFGASSLEELLTGLIEIDKAVTCNGMRLGKLLQCALENKPHEV